MCWSVNQLMLAVAVWVVLRLAAVEDLCCCYAYVKYHACVLSLSLTKKKKIGVSVFRVA